MKKQYIITLLVLLLIVAPTTLIRANYYLSNEPLTQLIKEKRVTINMKDKTLDAILMEITKQTNLGYGYQRGVINKNQKFTINVKNLRMEETLKSLLKDSQYDYKILNNRILIIPRNMSQSGQQQTKLKLKGKVIETDTGAPVPGATIIVLNTTKGAIADENGSFTIDLNSNDKLEISCIGMKTLIYDSPLQGNKEMVFSLQRDVVKVDDVVVTGYFNKKKESYTGAVTSFSGKELRSVSTGNLLSSLSMLDPSFARITDNNVGSNPNALPNFEIRGSSSLKSEFAGTNNMPTFILDGFEVSAQKIFDLDPNRVKTMTILKDASAAVIYGSRAANGIVVIETITPSEGKLTFSYSTSVNFEAADLSAYNLMNSYEKLDYEKKAGIFGDFTNPDRPDWTDANLERYNQRLKLVASGVYTDWIKLPVKKLGIGHRHTIMADGGSENFQYSLSLNYSNKAGVMRGSERDSYGGNVQLQYNLKNLKFSNSTSFDQVKSIDSPYGNLSEYGYLNPYYTPYYEDGTIGKMLYSYEYYSAGVATENVPNYLYNSTIPGKDEGYNTSFINNFSLEYDILSGLKFKANISVSIDTDGIDIYKSKENIDFVSTPIKGSYYQSKNKGYGYDANAVLTYFKVFGDHDISAGFIYNITETQKDGTTINVSGFPNANMDHVSMGLGYLEKSKPNGTFDIQRLLGFAGNVSYSYRSRYLTDFSIRSDASSIFGSNKRWGTFWSAGIGWNIHKENFLAKTDWISLLKIRASIGTTGGQNFSPYESMIMFTYGENLIYGDGLGAVLKAFGNKDLKWQLIEKKNIGFDWELFDRRITGSFNYYSNLSRNVLTDVSLAPSLGATSYRENLGEVKNSGVEFSLRVAPLKLKNELKWDVFFNMAHNKNQLMKINSSLMAFNNSQDRSIGNKPVVRYQEGLSMNTIWVNKSLGIDPMTGTEIFVGANGKVTDIWSATNYKPYACNDPKIFGNIGTAFYFKGFEFNASFYYKFGGYTYNSTLADKIENVNPNLNGDRRILYDRWSKVGDVAKYKKVSDVSKTEPTSRFVEKENFIQLESISLAYQFESDFLRKAKIERLRISAIGNDIFTASTVRMERGISYPFARTFSAALQITF